MRAKKTGTCPVCVLAIIPGHTLRWLAGRWVHLKCYRPKADPAYTQQSLNLQPPVHTTGS